jgi:hypothetical protein
VTPLASRLALQLVSSFISLKAGHVKPNARFAEVLTYCESL